MKRTAVKIAILIMLFLFFGGCAREEFMDLFGFTERFTYSDIGPEDFFTEMTEEGKNSFFTYFEKENPRIMLKLICTAENKIDEVRIYIPKYDENADKKSITTEDISLFLKITAASIKAFTNWEEKEIDSILNEMYLYERKAYENEGELTMTKNNFHLIYHSASLGSEFIIINTYLKSVPETEKPESKPLYGDTTKIRTETVPTK
ncbi:MAG: hypothetical protein IJN88_06920 [Clostridia bacterium]|nr:hypothetical protein [Clostridia bacterium]